MAIQGFNIEEDNEEIRDEIEEGVNMYEEDKAIPAYDIKLTLDDVSGMTPGIITEKPGLKIIGDIIEETVIRLIKNIADQVFIVDTLNDDQVNQIVEEAMINAPFEDVIEDATIIEDIIKEDVVTEEPLVEEVLEEEEVIEPTTEVTNDINLTSNETIDLNQGTVNMDLDSMFSDDEEIIDEDLISEDGSGYINPATRIVDILEVTEDGSGYINPATGEVKSFDNLEEVSLEDVIFPDDEEIIDEDDILEVTEDEINQIEAQVINEARKEEIKEAPVRDATYIKETNSLINDAWNLLMRIATSAALSVLLGPVIGLFIFICLQAKKVQFNSQLTVKKIEDTIQNKLDELEDRLAEAEENKNHDLANRYRRIITKTKAKLETVQKKISEKTDGAATSFEINRREKG